MSYDIFKRTFCKKCNFKYDKHLQYCPKCKEENDEYIQNRCKNPLFFIDLLKCIWIIFTWAILMYVLPTIVSFIVQSIDPNIIKLDEFTLGLQLSIYLAAFIVFILLLWNYKSYIFKDFKNWKNIVLGIGIGLALIGVSQLISYLIFDLGQVQVNSNQDEVATIVKNSPILSFFVVVICGPIFEEVIYRVGLMGFGIKLSEKYGKIIAYAVSIIIFTLVHINFFGENINIISEIAAIPGYLVGAIALCVAYDKGGISSSIIAHILNNLFSYILVMVM